MWLVPGALAIVSHIQDRWPRRYVLCCAGPPLLVRQGPFASDESLTQAITRPEACTVSNKTHDPLTRSLRPELGRSSVLVDQSTEDLMASDRGVEARHNGRIMVGRVLVEALMRSVPIEMAHILVNDGAGVPLVVDQQSVGALLANAANEPARHSSSLAASGKGS